MDRWMEREKAAALVAAMAALWAVCSERKWVVWSALRSVAWSGREYLVWREKSWVVVWESERAAWKGGAMASRLAAQKERRTVGNSVFGRVAWKEL